MQGLCNAREECWRHRDGPVIIDSGLGFNRDEPVFLNPQIPLGKKVVKQFQFCRITLGFPLLWTLPDGDEVLKLGMDRIGALETEPGFPLIERHGDGTRANIIDGYCSNLLTVLTNIFPFSDINADLTALVIAGLGVSGEEVSGPHLLTWFVLDLHAQR